MFRRTLLLLVITTTHIAITSSVRAQAVDWTRAEADAADAERQLATQGAAHQTSIVTPAAQAYNDYYIANLKHRAGVFAWQAFASKVIFWMVMLLVLAGLVFSAVQFYDGLHRNTVVSAQEIEISIQKVKVTSQFLGVVTLAISLAFFYLYVTNVFPIVSVETSQSAAHNK